MQTTSDRLRSSANMCTRVNAAVALLCEAALSGADEIERLRAEIASKDAMIDRGSNQVVGLELRLDHVTWQRNDLLDRLDRAQAEIRALESKLLEREVNHGN